MKWLCCNIGKMKVMYHHLQTPLSFMGLAVNVGSRDEIGPMPHGIAHLLEHVIFLRDEINGSKEIDDFCKINCCKFDASTSREDTMFLMEFLEGDLNKILKHLFNTVFNPAFSKENLEKEKLVINAEICRNNDSIECQLLDQTIDLLYSGNALCNRVLGYSYTINQINCDNLYGFHKRYYTLDNTVFFYIGNTSYLELLQILEKIYSNYCESNDNCSDRVSPIDGQKHRHFLTCTFQQSAHMMLSNYAPNQSKSEILSFSLAKEMLSNSLGGGILLSELRDKESLLYNIQMNSHLFSDAAFWDIRFDCPIHKHQRCVELLTNILNNIEKYIIKEDLDIHKNSLKFKILKKEENLKKALMDNALIYLHDGIIINSNEANDLINIIKINDILELSEKWLSR